MITAMLFAGGVGSRMKSQDMPKQFLVVGGKPIIVRTMENFAKHPEVDAIVVACKADWIDYLQDLIVKFNVKKVKAVVPGGENGFNSIHNGVVATAEFQKNPEDLILICDGVRPMISQELISNCIEEIQRNMVLLCRLHHPSIPCFTARTVISAISLIRDLPCM